MIISQYIYIKNLLASAEDMGSALVREDPTRHLASKPVHRNS